ncbi:helix-turn-helix domain-containing protein [Phaeovulum sp. W22_SRMD_FR3]|uniref:helix-turn-helix domain-containing protein n=1 Tax=Phaeovulum sp. W22_SRMD_FR3 TaxID=3240274 RepID=UPI003F9BCBC2
MTPAQCRAARALMGMTQPQLADAASVGLSTIVDFEKDRRQVSASAVAEIKSALEKSGVIFISEHGIGVGVKIALEKMESRSG